MIMLTPAKRFRFSARLLSGRFLSLLGSVSVLSGGCALSFVRPVVTGNSHQGPPSREVFSLPLKADVSVDDLAYSPDGKLLATAVDETLTIWSASDGRLIQTQKASSPGYQSVAFSPNGKRYAAINVSLLCVWDTQTGRLLRSITGDASDFNSLCFLPDGKRILTGSWGKKAKVWDWETGRLLLTLENTVSFYAAVGVSRDGRLIATSHDFGNKGPGFVCIWDAHTGRSLRLLRHTLPITSVEFSPDGRTLLAGCVDSIAKVWDVQTGQELLTLSGHKSEVYGIAFTPDGQRICTGSLDGMIKIWDTKTGQELFSLQGKRGLNMKLACSPDGKRLFASNGDGAKVWNIEAISRSDVR